MDNYIVSHVTLSMGLTREAHGPNIDVRRFRIYAKAITGVLNTIEEYHGLYHLRSIAFIASLRLGHAVGPSNEVIASKLTTRRGIAPNSLITQSQISEAVYKQRKLCINRVSMFLSFEMTFSY